MNRCLNWWACSALLLALCGCATQSSKPARPYISKVWVADEGDGTYKNPVLYAVKEGKGLIDTCPLWDDDGNAFTAQAGRWIGAKVGLFCVARSGSSPVGYADYDWFRIE